MTPKRTRRRYTAEFKAEVALAALTERQPLAELAARYQLAPAQITRWKLQLCQQAAQVFAKSPAAVAPAPDVEPLYAAIGRLQMESTLLKKRWGHANSPATRRGPSGGPGWWFGCRPLSGSTPVAQQFLLSALVGKRLQLRPHAPAR